MRIVIFTGPTLSSNEGRAELDAEYLPPASEGDVYRAARRRPAMIGIIDGYFERVPSVWHKEILWAMTRGIHVFGSASMGALRAAELTAFGMEGVGAVYEAYRDGVLEDDDEVAVTHLSEEFGFRATSEAMVDIRATIASAVASGVLGNASGMALIAIAKQMFYPDRNYHSICTEAAVSGLPELELLAFKLWLPHGRISQKHSDALAMLRLIRERIENGVEPKQVRYSFENSSMWERAWRLAGEQGRDSAGREAPLLLTAVLNELKLDPEAYQRVMDAALLRCLAINHSYVEGLSDVRRQRPDNAREFWRRLGIEDPEARREWIDSRNLDDTQLAGLLEDEARVEWIRNRAQQEILGYVLDQLRLSGEYRRLVERVRARTL
jgi:hypothetical protein